MVLNCIVVDDEQMSKLNLVSLVEKSGSLNLLGTAQNGKEALDLIEKENVDLVFLDVVMPVMNGFEFLDELESLQPPKIILVTANKEHALKAFDYQIEDYLLKPVSSHRFNKAVNRVMTAIMAERKSSVPNNFLLLKLLRFMYTRGIETIAPKPSRTSLVGYSYPLLMESLEFSNQAHALDILENAELDGIFAAKFVDAIYLCNQCSNSFLNIRESCPKCGSSNLHTNELIHHFSCAYVGPEQEFKSKEGKNNLVCPKCSRELRHIGVDYDKPSSVFNCNNCDNTFQDPLLKAKCNNCGSNSNVEHLKRRVIKQYSLTTKGKDIAEGNVYIKKKMPTSLEDYELEKENVYFKKVVKAEIIRKSIADFESSLGIVRFENIDELYQTIGSEKESELISELQQILTNSVSPSDEINFLDGETLLILFPEKDIPKAKDIVDQLTILLRALIADNFDDFKLQVKVSFNSIKEGRSYEEHLEELYKQINMII